MTSLFLFWLFLFLFRLFLFLLLSLSLSLLLPHLYSFVVARSARTFSAPDSLRCGGLASCADGEDDGG